MAAAPAQSTAAKPISVLTLPHTVRAALIDAGYKTVDDLLDLAAGDLCTELNITAAQAEEVVRQVASFRAGPSTPSQRHAPALHYAIPSSQLQPCTAADLLAPTALPHFLTGSSSLDTLFQHFSPHRTTNRHENGSRKGKGKDLGITPGMVVEVAGPPGIGKSSLALRLALSARIARQGGDGGEEERVAEGEVLIVDTEGGLTPDRILKSAQALTRNTAVSATQVIKGIHLTRIATQVQMVALLNTLDEWLEQHPKVHLIVIDTLSYHFRQPNLEMKHRARIMESVKLLIGKASTVHQCAVVVTNQLATKLLTAENKPANFETGDRAVLMPQLGELWTTANTVRVVLFRSTDNERRYAHASSRDVGSLPWACFNVDHDGLPCDHSGDTV